jgi:hypothetical protein
MTGWLDERACLLACRFGELSQQSVMPHVWQVRRWTQYEPIFTHSSHSRRCGCLIDAIASMWVQRDIHIYSCSIWCTLPAANTPDEQCETRIAFAANLRSEKCYNCVTTPRGLIEILGLEQVRQNDSKNSQTQNVTRSWLRSDDGKAIPQQERQTP